MVALLRCGSLWLRPGERTYIMGIVNVTPDSFSDGALYNTPRKALDYALKLLDQGADIIDIGGVSTAPGAKFVSIEEELLRVIPVVKALAQAGISALCVDTSRALVASQALEYGACWINDQEAGIKDPKMPSVLAQAQACILMHRRGESGVLAGERYVYNDVVHEIGDFFVERTALLGLRREQVIVDPGIGFGKGLGDSLKLIKNMSVLSRGSTTLLGVSRKSFLGAMTGICEPKERDYASLGAMALGILHGAHIVRVHNVKAAFDMIRVLDQAR